MHAELVAQLPVQDTHGKRIPPAADLRTSADQSLYSIAHRRMEEKPEGDGRVQHAEREEGCGEKDNSRNTESKEKVLGTWCAYRRGASVERFVA